jgi:hypothetical protein
MIIARYATSAAAKLVELTESQNPETARKACLDIINLLRPNTEPKSDEQAEAEQTPQLSPELAGKLLAALAENVLGFNAKRRHCSYALAGCLVGACVFHASGLSGYGRSPL